MDHEIRTARYGPRSWANEVRKWKLHPNIEIGGDSARALKILARLLAIRNHVAMDRCDSSGL